MVTRAFHVAVGISGARETTSQLNQTERAVGNFGRGVNRLFAPLLGASFLTGILGGSLGGLALSGGTARNALDSITDSFSSVLEPLELGLQVFAEWLADQDALTQGAIALGAGVLFAAGSLRLFGVSLLPLVANPWVAILLGIAVAFYVLYTRSETFRDGVHDAFSVVRTVIDNTRASVELLIGVFDRLIALLDLIPSFDIVDPAGLAGDIPVIGPQAESVVDSINRRLSGFLGDTIPYGFAIRSLRDLRDNPDAFTLNPERNLLDEHLGSGRVGAGQGVITYNTNVYTGIDTPGTNNLIRQAFDDPNISSRTSGGP